MSPMPAEMPAELKLGLVQHACGAETEANLDASVAGIEAVARDGAELILLQELHRSRYFCQTETAPAFALAETIPGPTTEILGALAQRLNVHIVASIFERRMPGLHHNTAVVIGPQGNILGRYRKMHIPDDPGYFEKYYFAPGDLGFAPISTTLGELGVLVCWDQWFPEAARLQALGGAWLLLYPTAIGYDPGDEAAERQRQRDAWITVQRGHAIANGVYVAACNRVGWEPDPAGGAGIRFWGHSFVAGPQGEILLSLGEEAGTGVVTLSRDRLERVREAWPYLRDRRVDAYQDLLRLCRKP